MSALVLVVFVLFGVSLAHSKLVAKRLWQSAAAQPQPLGALSHKALVNCAGAHQRKLAARSAHVVLLLCHALASPFRRGQSTTSRRRSPTRRRALSLLFHSTRPAPQCASSRNQRAAVYSRLLANKASGTNKVRLCLFVCALFCPVCGPRSELSAKNY